MNWGEDLSTLSHILSKVKHFQWVEWLIKTACSVQVKYIARGLGNDQESYKKEAYIRPIDYIRELKEGQKIQAMGFNKQNITLHGLHVHDNARFSVGCLCRCCTKKRRRSVLKRGVAGGLIFHSAIRTPLLKFFKMSFALFVGTSNVHSV